MLTKTIPSYLYWQYRDDSDLGAFVRAYNDYTQQYIDWFNQINLPIYTSSTIVGNLLDWVAQGLYGSLRPVLPAGLAFTKGPYNTLTYNAEPYNSFTSVGPKTFFVTTDDVFKRILTWNFYKGDGNIFSVRWLKRRIMRFLNGVNGTDPGVNQTYQISVSFGGGGQVNIRILSGLRQITGGSMYNRNAYNRMLYNHLDSTFEQLSKFELAPILQSAINSGAVELPFQYTYIVSV